MEIDAIILSKTSDMSHYGLTCRTINSLKSSSDWNGNIIVVESEKELGFKQNGFSYPNCNVLFPEEEFNYNRFLNLGIKESESEWIMICNNDLFFTKDWFTNIRKTIENNPTIQSFSPKAPTWHLHNSFNDSDLIPGYIVSAHVCGWCILVHRDVISKCNLFDETFKFWYQDNDYAMSLKSKGVIHALDCSSKVYHMVSGSHDILNKSQEMTHGQQQNYINKWKNAQ